MPKMLRSNLKSKTLNTIHNAKSLKRELSVRLRLFLFREALKTYVLISFFSGRNVLLAVTGILKNEVN